MGSDCSDGLFSEPPNGCKLSVAQAAAKTSVPAHAATRLTDGSSGNADAVDPCSSRSTAVGDQRRQAATRLSNWRLRHRVRRGGDREGKPGSLCSRYTVMFLGPTKIYWFLRSTLG